MTAPIKRLLSRQVNSKTDQPYGINTLVDGIDPVVDLVAVHGLDGHREGTWTAANGALWLRDYLPSLVPNVRILTYGYDARTLDSTPLSCQNLHDHGIGLVTELTLYRRKTKTKERPIIFIAHDIGGVIVKDALIHSNAANKDNLEHQNSIKTSTYGVLFFGTPHQGSDVLACPPNILALLQKTNERISKNLAGGSELLQKQLGQYNHISSSFVTKCFYETNKSLSGKELVVPTSSAIIPGATNVEVYAINSDHEGMVKYKSADDDGFKKVASCIESMVGDAPEKVLENWQTWNRVRAAESNGVPITFEIPFEPQYPRNPQFTGRRELLSRLRQSIEGGHSTLAIAVLYGTGGIGKTQIVSEYIHTYQKEYQSIFWIHAATKESIEHGFRVTAQRLVDQYAKIAHGEPNYDLIAKSLDFAGAVDEKGSVSFHEDHTDCVVRGVKLWLAKEGNHNWLLVFDNVDDLDNSAIEAFLPTAKHGTIIMTSRRTESGAFGTGLRVEEMQEEEAKALFLKSAALEDDPIAVDLVRKLGFLPLAIAQGGAYIGVRQMSLTRYLEIYEKRFQTVSAEMPPKATWTYGERTVWTTWEISFQAIKDTNPRAAELLSLCSFISNEDIWDDMLRRGKGLARDDITLDDSLRLLFSYSLAQRKGRNDSFYIHPVVHLWAHERLGESERVRITKEALGLVAMDGKHLDFITIQELTYQNKILPHVTIAARWGQRYLKAGMIDLAVCRNMSSIGMTFYRTGRSQHAEVIYLQIRETLQGIVGKDHPDTLVSMGNLALTYSEQGRYKEAEVLELAALETCQSVLGKGHPDTLRSMNNLASTYSRQGRYKEAEVLELEALETRQSVLGKGHLDTLTSMNNLASTYSNQGRYKEAEVLQLAALETYQSVLGKGHPDTLTSMNNLASTYSRQGRYKEAEVLELAVLETCQSILGKGHPDTLTSMNNLASTYSRQGRYKEAEVLQLAALETCQSVLGKGHPDTLTSMNNLASTYSDQGRHKEAEVLKLAVLETRQSVLGKGHPDTLTSMNNLASTYNDQGRYKEAEELQLQAFGTAWDSLGDNHPITLSTKRNLEATQSASTVATALESIEGELAELEHTGVLPEGLYAKLRLSSNLYKEGQCREAKELLQQVTEELKPAMGAECDPMMQAAIAMSLQQDKCESNCGGEVLDENDPNPLEIVNNLAAALGDTHMATTRAMTSLAHSLWEQERWGEAGELQLRLVRAAQEVHGKEDNNTLVAMTHLAFTYMQQGRVKDAEEIQLQVVECMRRTQENPDPEAIKLLAVIYSKQGRREEAVELIKELSDPEDDELKKVIAMSLIPETPGESSSHGEKATTMSLIPGTPGDSSSHGKRKLGENRPDYIKTMADQAATCWDLGQFREAEELEVKVKNSRRRFVGGGDPSTLLAMTNLAATYRDQERWQEAEELELQVVETRRKALPDGHPDTLTAITNLAGTYTDQGRLKEAGVLYREVVKARMKSSGKHHPRTLSAMVALATNHWHLGELDKSEILELKVVESRKRIFGVEHLDTLTAVRNLAATYAGQDRYDEAEKLQKEVLRGLRRTLGEKHFETVSAQELVAVYSEGKERQSESLREQWVVGPSGGTGDEMIGAFLFFTLFLASFFIFSCYRMLSNFISSFPFFSLFIIYTAGAMRERSWEVVQLVAGMAWAVWRGER